MSFSRRLAAGLPAVGVTVLAALALSGSPASAAEGAAQAALPAVMTSPDPAGTRGADDYSGTANETAAPAATETTGGTRGKPGYGGESPAPSSPAPSSPAPSSEVPGGTAAETVEPVPSATTAGAGVSDSSTLPVTGAPLTGTIALGGLLVAAGSTAVWYTRRRRA
ncbi:hypothetical protein ACTI_08470 [Actinoplanes sp. OR16]|uniref:hypothetical protein n=1 Tax=Actinoplanes sp. OR16 TaxID=946334 RepID=UPI000F6F2FF6|nr:hypothetical protein [Actinoplanes sp. OR16]BBH64162.1 hypothetical protein ACTI_08470 [Actinoplanes sp. OR16]